MRSVCGAFPAALALGVVLAGALVCFSWADDAARPEVSSRKGQTSEEPILTPPQWKDLDQAVDQGLGFISKNQAADGSFPTVPAGQPGVTSLCVMALLARGHRPGSGPHGTRIERAIDFVLSLQDPEIGGIMWERYVIARNSDSREGNYNHGISATMLAEVYGMTGGTRNARIRAAILKALDYTHKEQSRPKQNVRERGGWRYIHDSDMGADLAVTAWQLMFLRAARNAEFDVPKPWVDEALGYVHRAFDVNQRAFVYGLTGHYWRSTRAMVGAGIVCLELGGEHRSETAKAAGEWILGQTFTPYNTGRRYDRYHYSAFYCSQAMFQLGGKEYRRFLPGLLAVLKEAQHADGSWDAESYSGNTEFGNVYTTALAVLALSPPYQILPIYQR